MIVSSKEYQEYAYIIEQLPDGRFLVHGRRGKTVWTTTPIGTIDEAKDYIDQWFGKL